MKFTLWAYARPVLMAAVMFASIKLRAQSTTFTYQGRLNDGASPASGHYDLTFKLFSALSGPAQLGPTLTNSNLAISNGLFTVALDFGAVFSGTNVWLELGVRTNSGGAFTTLGPRQSVTPAPYALFSANAGNAATAATVIGAVSATNLTGTIADARLSTNVALLGDDQIFSGTNNFQGVLVGNRFVGNGVGLTNLNATNLFGTLADARLSGNVPLLTADQVFIRSNLFNGPLVGTNLSSRFAGNGAGLTSLNTSNLLGILADLHLSGNVALHDTNQSFTGSNLFAGPLIGTNLLSRFSGNGGGLTNLNSSNLVFTIADARLSTNVAFLKINQVFTNTNVFAGRLVATNPLSRFAGDGGGLTNLFATNLVGLVAAGNLVSNVALLDANQTFSGIVRFTHPSNIYSGVITEQRWFEELKRRDDENAELRKRVEALEKSMPVPAAQGK